MSRYLSPHEIRRAMLIKGVSVESLAFKVGINPGTIRRLLNGSSLKAATLVRIGQTLALLPDVASAEVVDGVLAADGK